MGGQSRSHEVEQTFRVEVIQNHCRILCAAQDVVVSRGREGSPETPLSHNTIFSQSQGVTLVAVIC